VISRESLKFTWEVMGPWRVLRVLLLLPLMGFAVGFAAAGPSVGSRVVVGVITAGAWYVFCVGLYLYIEIKNRGALKQFEAVRARFDAMSRPDATAAAVREIEASGLFRAYPATRLPLGGLPKGVDDFFACYDRVDVILPDNPSPLISLCRSLVGPLENNADAFKFGESYAPGSWVALHVPSGCVVSLDEPPRAGQIARLAGIAGARHRSVWHLIAILAEWKRVGDQHGFKHPSRRPRMDKRPRWRVNGALG